MNKLPIRTRLVNARKQAGLTQEQLALEAKISRAYLSNIEKGKHTPSLEVAKKISDALKKSIEDIFFEIDVRKTHIK
ncbi:helix-turn-helix transcriptional regulator [Cytobacillus firmus]|uniref:helix-turn-helix transcriptional regulator n=1 Tax=Cytobacillus firmus TaxID=1399 RepID=UPI0026C13BF8